MYEFIIYKDKKFYLSESNAFIINGQGIKDIGEIKELFNFKNISGLQLESNEILEIKNLERFPDLKWLNLSYNKISKISNLKTLSNLEELELSGNQIEKIEGLDKLINLEFLFLKHNNIKKIENLENLKNLKELYLNYNDILKIENLEELKNLELLALTSNPKISEIENLDNLKNLKYLYLSGPNLTNIKGISKLKNLKEFTYVRGDLNHILSDFEGLEWLINLKYVKIDSLNIYPEETSEMDMVIVLRFMCMVRFDNYSLIEDWRDIFRNFPDSFNLFYWEVTKDKLEWYVHYCTENLLTVIQKILNDPKFDDIKRNQENKWKKIYERASNILSKKDQIKTLKEIVMKELEEEKCDD